MRVTAVVRVICIKVACSPHQNSNDLVGGVIDSRAGISTISVKIGDEEICRLAIYNFGVVSNLYRQPAGIADHKDRFAPNYRLNPHFGDSVLWDRMINLDHSKIN